MPTYHFHYRDQRGLWPSDIGIECESIEQAYLEAFQAAQQMWSELLHERLDPMKCAFEIADQSGAILFVLPFAEVLRTAQTGGGPQKGSPLRHVSQDPEKSPSRGSTENRHCERG